MDKEKVDGFGQFCRFGNGHTPVIHILLFICRIWVYFYGYKFCDCRFLLPCNDGTAWHVLGTFPVAVKKCSEERGKTKQHVWSNWSTWIQSREKGGWSHASAQHICALNKSRVSSREWNCPRWAGPFFFN